MVARFRRSGLYGFKVSNFEPSGQATSVGREATCEKQRIGALNPDHFHGESFRHSFWKQ